jgi:hypothetical protein
MRSAILQRLRKEWNEFVGPEATATDNTITMTLGLLGAIAAPNATSARRRTAMVDNLLLRALAMDLWGGAWANNTEACARWYERPGQTDADHLEFAALHAHPVVLAWMDRAERRRFPTWVWATARYGFLMASTVAIRRLPRRRRALGAALTAAGISLDAALGPSRAAPWFAPVYYSKLLLGHASAALWPDRALTSCVPAPVPVLQPLTE